MALGDRGWADEPAARTPGWGAALGGWTRSAVRGLALLVAVAVALAAYWAWSGRPRAVALVPQVHASGLPVAGASPQAAAGSSAGAGPAAAAAPIEPSAAPTVASTVIVHVAGQVARPGLVELPAGSRVADAVAAAGGATGRRATDTVNLARVLVDGEQVVVGATVGAPAAGGTAAAPALLDLNTASVTDLDALPGIGPVIAARILDWRAANGPFRSVEELGEVSGIGDAILAQVRSRLRV